MYVHPKFLIYPSPTFPIGICVCFLCLGSLPVLCINSFVSFSKIPYIDDITWYLSFSAWLQSVRWSPSPSMWLQMAFFHPFDSCVVFISHYPQQCTPWLFHIKSTWSGQDFSCGHAGRRGTLAHHGSFSFHNSKIEHIFSCAVCYFYFGKCLSKYFAQF